MLNYSIYFQPDESACRYITLTNEPCNQPYVQIHTKSSLSATKRPEASNLQKKNPTNTVLLARDHTMHYLNLPNCLPREGRINLNFNSHLIHPCFASKWCVPLTLYLGQIISREDNKPGGFL